MVFLASYSLALVALIVAQSAGLGLLWAIGVGLLSGRFVFEPAMRGLWNLYMRLGSSSSAPPLRHG